MEKHRLKEFPVYFNEIKIVLKENWLFNKFVIETHFSDNNF